MNAKEEHFKENTAPPSSRKILETKLEALHSTLRKGEELVFSSGPPSQNENSSKLANNSLYLKDVWLAGTWQ